MEAALAQQQADEEQQRKAWERLEVSHTIVFVCHYNAVHLLPATQIIFALLILSHGAEVIGESEVTCHLQSNLQAEHRHS